MTSRKLVSIMAKRIVKWMLEKETFKLTMANQITETNKEAVAQADFSLPELFPNLKDLSDVQQQLVIFAVKQKLMDTGASEKGDLNGKVKAAKEKWAELLAGKWTGERTNATGAAENKKLLATIKEKMNSEVVSMTSLMMKQALTPELFTEADQAKLNEFIQEAAKSLKKKAQ